MTNHDPQTDFQMEVVTSEPLRSFALRKLVLQYFPQGFQTLPVNIGFDRTPYEVPFTGLGEIDFFRTEEDYMGVRPNDRERYGRTQRTDVSREKLLEELIPAANSGILTISELDLESSQPSKYRHILTLQATDIGYVVDRLF